MEDAPVRGLEGVVAADTRICNLDGVNGALAYCGYDAPEMARAGVTFEEIVHLLWRGELPDRERLKAFDAQLKAERGLSPGLLRALGRMPPGKQRTAVLRAGVGAMGLFDPEAEDDAPEANLRKAVRLTAKMPTLIAAQHRLAAGLRPLRPRRGLGHAANFLYMITGEAPDGEDARALDATLVLYAEHEINASTFAARVVASTMSDIYSAVTAGVAALKGPLHGGAGLAVMETLREIGEVENVEPFVEAALARKRLFMGFGHRVYTKSGDPRAGVLVELAGEVCRRPGRESKWFEMAKALDRAVRSRKGVIPNVDFYSAPLWQGLGIPMELFVPVIAMSRVAGWTANVLEQRADNRLIRPRARYVGAAGRPYEPLGSRG